MSEQINEISIPEWYKPGGGMMYRRKYLPANHPENEYNYVKRTYNVDPEDFGIYHPDIEDVKDFSYDELKREVMKLKSQLRNLETIP